MTPHPEWFRLFLARAPRALRCRHGVEVFDRDGFERRCYECHPATVCLELNDEREGLYPTHSRSPERLRELARVCRDEANSAPLRELLDCIEAGHG